MPLFNLNVTDPGVHYFKCNKFWVYLLYLKGFLLLCLLRCASCSSSSVVAVDFHWKWDCPLSIAASFFLYLICAVHILDIRLSVRLFRTLYFYRFFLGVICYDASTKLASIWTAWVSSFSWSNVHLRTCKHSSSYLQQVRGDFRIISD